MYFGMAKGKQINSGGYMPPQSKEAEIAVLGLCLTGDSSAVSVAVNFLPVPECFYYPDNVLIYSAIKALESAKKGVDLLTVQNYLKDTGKLEEVGGIYHLTKLLMGVVTSAYHEDHCKIIYEKYVLRELIRVSHEAIAQAMSGEADPFQLTDQTGTAVNNILGKVSFDDPKHISDVVSDTLMEIEVQKQSGSSLLGISTGFSELDEATLGWAKTDMIVIAARPSQGKTALALNLAENAALAGHPVLFVSLETPSNMLVKRMLSSKSKLKFRSILTANLDDTQNKYLAGQFNHYADMKMHIEDKTFALEVLKRKIRKWNKKNPHGVVFIDYLQLIKVPSSGNREQAVATISRELKELAMELEIPIIALAQLNRQANTTADKKPDLIHIRESGQIEQDANIILGIWWETCDDGQLKLWLCVLKNKNGTLQNIQMKFAGDIQSWASWDGVDFEKPGFVQNIAQSKPAAKIIDDWGVPPPPDNPAAGINYKHYQEKTEYNDKNGFNEPI